MVQVKGLNLGKGHPKICAPMIGDTREELLREAILAKEAGADLVEWRIDYYEDVFQYEKVTETLVLIHEMLDGLPVLFTFRTIAEGGKRDITIRAYHELYLQMIRSGLVDMVDLELDKIESLEKELLAEIKQRNIPLIISSHMPHNERDVLRLMELTRRAGAFVSMPLITMSMGQLGMISRLSGNLTGSVMTFGALTSEKASAPGQITVKELKSIIKLLN